MRYVFYVVRRVCSLCFCSSRWRLKGRRPIHESSDSLTRTRNSCAQILIASGFLQFLYWHIVFDPHASNAGSGQLPCCGSRRNNAGGNQYGGGNGGGVQGGGYDDGSFNEMGRRRHLHKSRRLADEEAGLSSSASDAGGAPAPSYKSLGRSSSRRSSKSRSHNLSDDSVDGL